VLEDLSSFTHQLSRLIHTSLDRHTNTPFESAFYFYFRFSFIYILYLHNCHCPHIPLPPTLPHPPITFPLTSRRTVTSNVLLITITITIASTIIKKCMFHRLYFLVEVVVLCGGVVWYIVIYNINYYTRVDVWPARKRWCTPITM